MPPKIVVNLEDTQVKKPRKFQVYINLFFLILKYIVLLPCILNYGHWLLTVLLVFIHIFQGLYKILNAYTVCYLHMHETSEVLCCQQWKGSHGGGCDHAWDGGTHPLHPARLCKLPLDNAETHPAHSNAESPA